MSHADRDRPDVMVIDDNPDSCEAVAAVLELQGYTVMQVDSSVEALAILQRGARPRLILLDLNMPDLTGWGLARTISSDPELRSIPVAVMTGEPEYRGVPHRVNDAGIFRKPVDFDALVARVAALPPAGA